MKVHEYQSGGKDPYVIKVDHPKSLFGVHADLIGTALYPGESLLYLNMNPEGPSRIPGFERPSFFPEKSMIPWIYGGDAGKFCIYFEKRQRRC